MSSVEILDILTKEYHQLVERPLAQEEKKQRLKEIYDKAIVVCQPWQDSSIYHVKADFQQLDFLLALSIHYDGKTNTKKRMGRYIKKLAQSSHDNTQLLAFFIRKGYLGSFSNLDEVLYKNNLANFAIIIKTHQITTVAKQKCFLSALSERKNQHALLMLSYWHDVLTLDDISELSDYGWEYHKPPLMVAAAVGNQCMVTLLLALGVKLPQPGYFDESVPYFEKTVMKTIYEVVGYKRRISEKLAKKIKTIIWQSHMENSPPTLDSPIIQTLLETFDGEVEKNIITLYNTRHQNEPIATKPQTFFSIAGKSIFKPPVEDELGSTLSA